jgi:hypothetical protein
MSQTAPRRLGALLPAWAGALLALTAFAGWEGAPASLRETLAASRLAAHGGLLGLLLVTVVLPFRRGGPARVLEELLLMLVVAAPFAVLAYDAAPIESGRVAALSGILGSQALLSISASWLGVSRQGRAGTMFLAGMVLLHLGAPFLSYLLSEATRVAEGPAANLSSLWAARSALVDPVPGPWGPAAGLNAALAALCATFGALGRARS